MLIAFVIQLRNQMRKKFERRVSGVQKSRALNFSPWKLKFAGPRSGICVVSPFWRLEILRWLLRFFKDLCALHLYFTDFCGHVKISTTPVRSFLHVMQFQQTSLCRILQDGTDLRRYRPKELSVEWRFNGRAYVLIITLCACTPALDCGYVNDYVSVCLPSVRSGNLQLLRFLHKRYFLYFAEALPRALYVSPRNKCLSLLYINRTFQSSHRDLSTARPRCNMLRIFPPFGVVACSHASSLNSDRNFRYCGGIIRICAANTSMGKNENMRYSGFC
jgi:hypothetical protein